MEETTESTRQRYVDLPHDPEDFDAMARLKKMRPVAEKALQWLDNKYPSLNVNCAPSQSYRARMVLQALDKVGLHNWRFVFGAHASTVRACVFFLRAFVQLHEVVRFLDRETRESGVTDYADAAQIIDALPE